MIPNRPTNGLRLVFLVFLTLLSLIASAQDALAPRWVRAGWPNLVETPQYSNAGDRLLLWNGTGAFSDRSQKFRVYRVADGAILAQVNFGPPETSGATQGDLTGACFSADGTKVYYATDHGLLFAFDIDARTQTLLSPREKQGRPVYALTASKDGRYLAYMAGDPSTTSYDLACVYNVATDHEDKQFQLTNASGRAKTTALAFVDGGTKLAASGPTVYTLTGTKLKQGTLDGSPFVVSPDRTSVYVYAQGSSPQVYAYSATNFSSGLTYEIRWQKPAPAGTRALSGVSSDGNAVVFSCLSNSGVWSASGLNAANGAPIANPFVSSTALTASFVVPSPSSSVLLVTTGTLAELWNFSPFVGSGTLARTLFDGVGNGKPPTFVETRGLGSPGPVAVVTDEIHGTGTERTMRDAWTGEQIGGPLLAGAYPSPDGRFYVLLAGGGPFGGNTVGVNVYPAAGGPSVASISLTGSYSRVVWGGSERFVVVGNGSGEVLDFDGASLVQGPAFTFGGFFGGGGFSISADGSKYAVWSASFGSNTCQVYDASTGATLRTISSGPATSGGIDAADFAGPDRIGVHEIVKQDTGGFRNQIRIFDLTVNPAKVVRTVGYPFSGVLDDANAGAAGALSADGRTIVLGHRLKSLGETDPRQRGSIRLYSAASGELIDEWDDQLLPDMSGAAPFTFSLDGRTVRWTTDGAIVAISTGSMLAVTLDPTSVPSESPSTGSVTVDEPVQADTMVTLASSSTAAIVPSSVVIPSGETSATFPIATKHVETNVSAKITASLGGQSASATLLITVPSLDGFTLSPIKVAPGGSSTGTVTLTAPAPVGGSTIALRANPATLATLPGSVTVAQGDTSATFTVTAGSVAQETAVALTASRGGVERTATLTVVPPTVTSLTLVPADVVGGSSSTGIVTISAAAPAAGTKVALKSSLASVRVPGSVSVPPGETSVSFPVTTTAGTTSVTSVLTATLGGSSRTASLHVLAVALRSFSLNPTAVVGGYGTTTATVALISPLPTDVTITLSSANQSLVPVPETLTIPAGQASGTFTVTPSSVVAQTSVTLKAILGNSALSTTLVVKPIELSKVEVAPSSVLGGSSVVVVGTVTLSGPAPAGGAKVALSSNSTATASVPAMVTIPAGGTAATFPVAHKGVAAPKTVTITAKLGSISKTCLLEVRAPILISLSVSPNSVKGGSSTKMTGTVVISAAAPSSGIKVALKSSNTSALTVPSSLTLKSATTATFAVTHKKVKSTTSVDITATLNGVTYTYRVTLTP